MNERTSWKFDPLRNRAGGEISAIPKDQREVLWLIREKRPKLVIGAGSKGGNSSQRKCRRRYVLLCAVLCHEQSRRGARFSHRSQWRCMADLPWVHGARGVQACWMSSTCKVTQEADGTQNEQASSRTVHTLPDGWEDANVELHLDSDNCDGLSQKASDVDHAAALMHVANGAHLRLDCPINWSKDAADGGEGGQITQELNSICDGKHWDEAKRGMVGSCLDSVGA